MSDRTYTRFSIPMSVLADAGKTEVVRSAFGIPLPAFQAAMLSGYDRVTQSDEHARLRLRQFIGNGGQPLIICKW